MTARLTTNGAAPRKMTPPSPSEEDLPPVDPSANRNVALNVLSE
jgi:hypothetical protein